MVLKHQCASEWPRELVKTQTSGPHPRSPYSVDPTQGTGIHISVSPRWNDAATLREPVTHPNQQLLRKKYFSKQPLSLKDLWQQWSPSDKVQHAQPGKFLKGGPSVRQWVRIWWAAAALTKCPVISGCCLHRPPLAQRVPSPAACSQLPGAEWQLDPLPTHRHRGPVGVVRTWVYPPGWTSSPLPPTFWCQLCLQENCWGFGCHGSWSSIHRGK